jgi:hypothetical protein
MEKFKWFWGRKTRNILEEKNERDMKGVIIEAVEVSYYGVFVKLKLVEMIFAISTWKK